MAFSQAPSVRAEVASLGWIRQRNRSRLVAPSFGAKG